MAHKTPLIYRSKPSRFFSQRLRPTKADSYQEMVAWHLQAVRNWTYPLESSFPEETQRNLTRAVGHLIKEGQTVQLQKIHYGDFAHLGNLKPFFHPCAGSSLEIRINCYFSRQTQLRYTFWQSSDRLISNNIETIFLMPLADVLDDHWPQLSKVGANHGKTMHSLFLENLRCILICAMVSLTYESPGDTRLLQHLLEATKYCLPLCFDKKNPNLFYILVP